MVKVCGRCTWLYENIDTGKGVAKGCCNGCVIKIGGQQSYANITQYLLNKNYFSSLVLTRIKNRRYI